MDFQQAAPYGAGDPTAPLPAPGFFDSLPAGGASLCLNCRVYRGCIGSVAAEAGTARLRGVLAGRIALAPGEVLQREPVGRTLYVVRSGCLKSAQAQDDGGRVLGFHLPGDLVEVSGAQVAFTAVDATELCAVRWRPGAMGDADTRAFVGRLWDMLSCERLREHAQHTAFAALAPHQRVASFLSTLAGRLRARGHGAGDVRLRLSVREIASYLRLPADSVGDALASFVRRGLLQGGPGQLRIVDAPALQRESRTRRAS